MFWKNIIWFFELIILLQLKLNVQLSLCQGEEEDDSSNSVEDSKENLEKLRNWKQVFLEEHNLLRRKHGVPDLLEDRQLDKLAQKYAEHLAKTNTFNHSKDNDFGENLMLTPKSNEVDAVKDAVASWYEEIKDYDFKKPGYKEITAHFTEMVWKGDTHVGVGIKWNEKEEQFVVVANYRPGGNVEGEYELNVLPGLKDYMYSKIKSSSYSLII